MPNSEQQDIRVIKTRKALAETLLALLERKSFQKITVNDICQNATVSRSTFYLHFEDKYQLLQYCLRSEQERLGPAMKEGDPREFLRQVLEQVKEREKTYRNLFQADVNQELIRMFRGGFHSFFHDALEECERQGAELPGPVRSVAAFYASGLTGMMMWWIEEGYPISVEEMALCQYNLLADIMPE